MQKSSAFHSSTLRFNEGLRIGIHRGKAKLVSAWQALGALAKIPSGAHLAASMAPAITPGCLHGSSHHTWLPPWLQPSQLLCCTWGPAPKPPGLTSFGASSCRREALRRAVLGMGQVVVLSIQKNVQVTWRWFFEPIRRLTLSQSEGSNCVRCANQKAYKHVINA
jgi:hypothetical protein